MQVVLQFCVKPQSNVRHVAACITSVLSAGRSVLPIVTLVPAALSALLNWTALSLHPLARSSSLLNS